MSKSFIIQIKAVYNNLTNFTESYILNLMTESNKEQIQTKKSFKLNHGIYWSFKQCNFNIEKIFSNFNV